MIGQVTCQTFADMFHAKEALQSFTKEGVNLKKNGQVIIWASIAVILLIIWIGMK